MWELNLEILAWKAEQQHLDRQVSRLSDKDRFHVVLNLN